MSWQLEDWAGAEALQLAEAVVAKGAVRSLSTRPLPKGGVRLRAEVYESRMATYAVDMTLDGPDTRSSCTCRKGDACAHAVAVALTYRAQQAPAEAPEQAPSPDALAVTIHLAPPPKRMEKEIPGPVCAWLGFELGALGPDGLLASARPLQLWAPMSAMRFGPNDQAILDAVLPYFKARQRDFSSPHAHGVPLTPELLGAIFPLLAKSPWVYGPMRAPLSIRPDWPIPTARSDSGEWWFTDEGPPSPAQWRFRLEGEPAWALMKDTLRPLAPAPEDVGVPEGSPEGAEAAPGMLVAVGAQSLAAPRPAAPGAAAPELRHPDVRPMARLTLFEEGDRLLARLSFRYGTSAPVAPEDPRALVGAEREGEFGFYGRDFEAERAWLERMKRTSLEGKGLGQYLGWGDLALGFLFDDVPALLAEGLELFGEERLRRLRADRRGVSVSVGVRSGIDWFDLSTSLTIEGQPIAWAAIREALKGSSRFVRLGDGGFARLPEAWLAQQQRLAESLGYDADPDPEQDGVYHQRMPRYLAASAKEALDAANQQDVDAAFERYWVAMQAPDADAEAPPGFLGELRPYQRQGLSRLRFWRDYGLGGILADEMGLGKTIQAIALLMGEHAEGGAAKGPSLLVAPTSVVYNWESELRRFAPGLRVVVLHGSDRHSRVTDFAEADVIVTSFGLLQRDAHRLLPTRFHYVILDEAQKIKNARSQAARTACKLQAAHRLCLTGTPIENNLLEFWSLYHFLMPGLLGSERRFRQAYLRAGTEEAAVARERLRALTRPFVLRRLKADVARDLPPRSEIVQYCELSEAQRALYSRTLEAVRGSVYAEIASEGLAKARFHVLEGLLRLRQIACDPRLVLREADAAPPPSAKLAHLVELLREAIDGGHRVLVFSQFVAMLKLIKDALTEADIAHAYLDGQTKDRLERVQRFNADDTPVFLISLKAGGTGLNLTGADYVVHFDPWWNPAVEDQATDRAHRIGQTRHVFSYKLIAKDTVEEKVLQLQAQKRDMVRDVLGSADAVASLGLEELNYLLS